MPLDKYRAKRAAEQTPEPVAMAAKTARTASSGLFVVQKHCARRLHYDFRLEMEGVLRSWAVPKGPSMNPADKRLAVMVEDHPIEYGDFEGVIPEGNYGAGSVIVWDRGMYRAIDPPADAATAVRAGKLDIELHGFKLRGAYTLVRTRGMFAGRRSDDRENWLLIKKRDAYASEDDVLARRPRSVLSGLTVEETRDVTKLVAEVEANIAGLNPPRLKGALEPKMFPLMLAKLVREPFDGERWFFEIKYDGVRALAIRDGEHVRIFGRSGAEITAQYPEVAIAIGAIPFPRFVLDGEIATFSETGKPSFQLLQKRIQAREQAEIRQLSLEVPTAYQAFDLLAFDGYDLRTLALEKRKSILARIARDEGVVRYCDHIVAHGKALFAEAQKLGLEGIMAKRRDSAYRGIRSDDWRKIKCPRTRRFVIGGWTDPEGARSYFGALLLGAYESDGRLRFVSRVGTGFDQDKLRSIYRLMEQRKRATSPFRPSKGNEPKPPRGSHFCEPEPVCEVSFAEWTDDGGLRHPSFQRIVANVSPQECLYEGPGSQLTAPPSRAAEKPAAAPAKPVKEPARSFTITNPDKVFWPAERYTKRDLVEYYRAIAPWMLPYLKDRPVMLTRYPDGIEGKSFYQKDAPDFAPSWIRTEKVWSEDSGREISYFILESAEALCYMANLGAIPIHIWSSRVPRLERPDWLLFDIDPKNSTTAYAVKVARELHSVLRAVGLRPYVKTSGQAGIHVMVGLALKYAYEQARMFSELVARVVVDRAPEHATLARDVSARNGRAYIDYLQLGHGKTIAAPFAVRPIPGAPVSAPLRWDEVRERLDPRDFNIRTMPRRMARLKRDPFIGAIEDRQEIEPALANLEQRLSGPLRR
jgi:bifunctional non-homologous end joining protein LigD